MKCLGRLKWNQISYCQLYPLQVTLLLFSGVKNLLFLDLGEKRLKPLFDVPVRFLELPMPGDPKVVATLCLRFPLARLISSGLFKKSVIELFLSPDFLLLLVSDFLSSPPEDLCSLSFRKFWIVSPMLGLRCLT